MLFQFAIFILNACFHNIKIYFCLFQKWFFINVNSNQLRKTSNVSYLNSITYAFIVVNGNWSEWSEWANCTLQCWKIRTRTCTNPSPQYFGNDCKGSHNDTFRCWVEPCDSMYQYFHSYIIILPISLLKKIFIQSILLNFVDANICKSLH